MFKPHKVVYIDKNQCDVCTKKLVCSCKLEGRETCPMICIKCGKCLCHPEKKDCCIDGHYAYNGDFIFCMECHKKKTLKGN